ncbi:MAG: hypothetical protein KBD62_35765 [Kofleriaceae bacterium]|nr:hypothetical protein [Kofleriaceae bacterium]
MPTTPKTTKTTSNRRGDDARARELMTWARLQGIHVSRIRVGDVELDGLIDLRRVALPTPTDEAHGTDLRTAFGGAGLERMRADAERQGGGVFQERRDPDDDD